MSIVLRPQAETDLDEAWFHIALDSLERADSYIAELYRRISALVQSPSMGRPVEEIRAGLWMLPIDSYLVPYMSTDERIDVVRIWHTSRDIGSILFPDDD